MIHHLPVLRTCLGQVLRGGQVMLLYDGNELLSGPQHTYLQFDEWIDLVTADEQTMVYAGGAPPEQPWEGPAGPHFRFPPLADFCPAFQPLFGRRLLTIAELVQRLSPEQLAVYPEDLRPHFAELSYGVRLGFEHARSLIIWNPGGVDGQDQTRYLFDAPIPNGFVEVPR
jgi:hypothetical protein